jgi:hypothetical protein
MVILDFTYYSSADYYVQTIPVNLRIFPLTRHMSLIVEFGDLIIDRF